ncbi:pyruvate dehydrogenase (acetyl-transferring), homodimeric type [bacterium]|nr:pyruvate dehydrogenase (acetyl-transferring), homodimeric type [bacterium]
MFPETHDQLPDLDAQETAEWLESFDSVVETAGPRRAEFLLRRLLTRAKLRNLALPALTRTAYVNTIAPQDEPDFPGDEQMERRIRRLIRWNAAAMVTRTNRRFEGLGGHLSTYASAATLYEVGFNHFFRGKDDGPGDQIYYQGHGAPGLYSRAFLEGRLSEAQLDLFRREVSGGPGLPSYPHPYLMPDFWEFPTVSMGLGPMAAIYQARFNRYLHARGIADTSNTRVWAFLGDGETDEPEALGALSIAAREQLSNLTFVVNCNLQRLDGPVRGNGKIIQELEGKFRGAGWNVIKVIWGSEWDDLLGKDVHGLLQHRMMETLDGQYQRFSVESGAYIREHFFGPEPELASMVAHLDDDRLRKLRRGGHDYRKVYAAYRQAVEHESGPTVVLAKTVKGWTLGEGFEARNVTHQMKKLSTKELMAFRDRLELPIRDEELQDMPPYYHPGENSEEIRYLKERRAALGGELPKRIVRPTEIVPPRDEVFDEFKHGTKDGPQVSTTMAFVRLLRGLLRSKDFGRRVVPIVPDEARTFGMEGLFKEFRIYSPFGQKYVPVDAELLLSYSEGADGQILEEGLTEAGSMGSFTASGTSYATFGEPTIPFYIFYSMFGFQRTMDQIWAFADSRGRGFLMGATAGRTTLQGEGLQHMDGHSQLMASAVPNVEAYDPAYAFEVSAIVRDGIRRMYGQDEDVFYYITIYNENYQMPSMPEGVEEGILRGLYRFRAAEGGGAHKAQLLGSGPLLQEALRAQQILAERYDVAADVWSATSYTKLRREALDCERHNREHPDAPARTPLVTQLLDGCEGPVIASSDWMKAVPDQIARWVKQPYHTLGTDGFGRSDTRTATRRFFRIDAENIVLAALAQLAAMGRIPVSDVLQARGDLLGDGAGSEPAPELGTAHDTEWAKP